MTIDWVVRCGETVGVLSIIQSQGHNRIGCCSIMMHLDQGRIMQ
jgi:hypothetical protein